MSNFRDKSINSKMITIKKAMKKEELKSIKNGYCIDGCLENAGDCDLENSGFAVCPKDKDKCELWKD